MKIALIPKYNSKHRKADVTGAFRPESRRFMKAHGGGEILTFDNRLPAKKRRAQVEGLLSQVQGKYDMLAIFCHGMPSSIQTGHKVGSQLKSLAKVIANGSEPWLRVSLYCCNTARNSNEKQYARKKGPGGDGGFADELRDELGMLGKSGGWVDGHTVTGHTTLAPYVRRFYTTGSRGNGGEFIVHPDSSLWKKWVKSLRAKGSRLRTDYPYMTRRQVEDYIDR